MNINELRVQVKGILDQWDAQTAGLQEDLQPWLNIQGFNKSHIRDELSLLVRMVERIEESENLGGGVVEYSINTWIVGQINTLPSYIQNVVANPAGHIPALLNCFYAIKQSLVSAFPLSFCFPGEVNRRIEELRKSEDDLREGLALSSELRNLSLQARQNAISIDGCYGSVNKLTESIANAHQTVLKNSEMIKEATSIAEQMRVGVGKLQSDVKLVELMAETCQKHADEIDSTLAAARRSGLAKAFTERAAKVKKTADFWQWAFFVSLGLLAILGAVLVGPYLLDHKLELDWKKVLLEIPLTAPFIWMAWYSAAKYSGYSRVWEDYEFKAASALSLEGYKREALDLDSNLAKELLEISLKNFGENPIRLYEKRQEPVSPLHAALETGSGIVENFAAKRKAKIGEDAA